MSVAIAGTVIGIGKSAYDAYQADKSAGKARKWQKRAIEENKRQYDQTREDWAPWRELGGEAINNLRDPDAFETSPAYDFIRGEGLRNMENQFSVRGGGGNAMRALNEYNKNLASTEYWNYRNDQRANAGLGASGAAGSAGANTNYANAFTNYGDNMGSIDMWEGGQFSNAVGTGLSNALYGWKTYANRDKEDGTSRWGWPGTTQRPVPKGSSGTGSW